MLNAWFLRNTDSQENDVKGKQVIGINKKTILATQAEISKVFQPIQWQAPQQGWLKLNVDASFIMETGQASTGAVIRNHQGTVILSAWRVLFDCSSAEEAEFAACYYGLHVASQWCQAPLLLESDSSICIRSLSSNEMERSLMVSWIIDAKDLMSAIGYVKLNLVKRAQNSVAHELSQYARQMNSTGVWLAGVPPCLEHLVLKDCTAAMT